MTKNSITQDEIDVIIADSTIKAFIMGEKTTVIHLTTKEGFEFVESSSCVDPANFDEVIGYNICINRIKNKLWELEGYCLQKEVYNNDKTKKA
jgi:hypothetical protein